MNPFPVLQTQFKLQTQSPTAIIISVTGITGFLLFILIAGIISGKRKSGKRSKSPASSLRSFRKEAKQMGLSKDEINILIGMAKKHEIESPGTLLINQKKFDEILVKAIEEIEMSAAPPNVIENRKYSLYHLKQKIEMNSQRKNVPTGTRQIPVGQQLILAPEGGGKFKSQTVSNFKDYIAVQIPVSNTDESVRWKKGTRMKVYFWKKNGQSFSFYSKILGFNTVRGQDCFFLHHSSSVSQAKQRRFRRKSLERPAYFYRITIDGGTGGKRTSKKKAYVAGSGALGTMVDVSAGGCAVRTSYPLGVSELIKIEFETYKRIMVVAFGKVLSIKKSGKVGGVMHIKFTRVSKEHINKINSYIYNISEE